jgi:hypothetical protein
LAPSVNSCGSVCSRGLWLMPSLLGTKIIAVGHASHPVVDLPGTLLDDSNHPLVEDNRLETCQ